MQTWRNPAHEEQLTRDFKALPQALRDQLPDEACRVWLRLPRRDRKRLQLKVTAASAGPEQLQQAVRFIKSHMLVREMVAVTPQQAANRQLSLKPCPSPGTLLTRATHTPGSGQALSSKSAARCSSRLTLELESARKLSPEDMPEDMPEDILLLCSMWDHLSNAHKKRIKFLLFKRRSSEAAALF